MIEPISLANGSVTERIRRTELSTIQKPMPRAARVAAAVTSASEGVRSPDGWLCMTTCPRIRVGSTTGAAPLFPLASTDRSHTT